MGRPVTLPALRTANFCTTAAKTAAEVVVGNYPPQSQFCDISAADCPDRVEPPGETDVANTRDF